MVRQHPIKYSKTNADPPPSPPPQLTKQLAWVLAAALEVPAPHLRHSSITTKHIPCGLSLDGCYQPYCGEKEQSAWAIGNVPMKTVPMPTCPSREKSLFLSLKGNLTHNSEQSLKGSNVTVCARD